MGLEPTTSALQASRVSHCATPPLLIDATREMTPNLDTMGDTVSVDLDVRIKAWFSRKNCLHLIQTEK